MTKLKVTAFAMLLAGCSPVITGAHVERAVEACSGHGGIARLDTPSVFGLADATSLYQVECVDRSTVNIGATVYVQK